MQQYIIQMEEKQVRDHMIIYVIGTIHAILHFIVGVIWETVGLPQGASPLLSLPYFGGELALVAVCLLLVFVYLGLGLRREPRVPVHIRRFCLTLSLVVTLASLVLMVVMCIRTNDYRKEKNAIAKEAYYGAVLMTVVDILMTIFFIPSYIYLTLCNYKLVKEEEQRIKKEAKQGENQEGQANPASSEENQQANSAGQPATDRNLQPQANQCTDEAQSEPKQVVIAYHQLPQKLHSPPNSPKEGPYSILTQEANVVLAEKPRQSLECLAVCELISPSTQS